jgi:DNA helicase-2/ATP-dependent DNA helicase PcrA
MTKPKFTPSAQQQIFFDWITLGTGSCVLEAVAGSGKTTTLIEALKLMHGSIFFGAFNKDIALEIASRAGARMGLDVSTMHAAGMKAWRRGARDVKVNADKCRDIFRQMTLRQFDYAMLESPVLQLTSYAKQAAVGIDDAKPMDKDSTWMTLINHFNIETFDEQRGVDNTASIIVLAKQLFQKSYELNTKVIDFDDMIFAPLFHGVRFEKYDWVLIDEAQDTNASRRLLSLAMLKKGGRLVAVGDRHQAIYGFTGADADALDLIGFAVNAKKLPLNVTYRCPKAVVTYAQQWVNHIHAHESAPDGIVREALIENLFEEVKVGDAILCRLNAPLIKNVYALIAKGIPARVEGREIGAGLKALANRWKVKSIDGLLVHLDAFQEREVKKFTDKEQPKRAADVVDKVECLRVIIGRVIAKGALTTPPQKAVNDEIDAIFGGDQNKPVVLLSSIHKSKGREWKKVVWLQTGPSAFAKMPWEIEQEKNLCYVATTRAQHELVLINIQTTPKK